MANLISARFPLLDCATKTFECFLKKRLNVVRLQSASVGALHILTYEPDAASVHGVMCKHVFFQQALQMIPVKGDVQDGGEERLNLWPLAVADCFNQKVSK